MRSNTVLGLIIIEWEQAFAKYFDIFQRIFEHYIDVANRSTESQDATLVEKTFKFSPQQQIVFARAGEADRKHVVLLLGATVLECSVYQ